MRELQQLQMPVNISSRHERERGSFEAPPKSKAYRVLLRLRSIALGTELLIRGPEQCALR